MTFGFRALGPPLIDPLLRTMLLCRQRDPAFKNKAWMFMLGIGF